MSSGRGETSRYTAGLELTEPGAGGQRLSLLVYHREGVEMVALRAGAPVVVGRAEPASLVAALKRAGWNQTETARRLRMPLRTLVYKLKAHGIKKLGYGAE